MKRAPNLIVQQIGDECVIYDAATKNAHSLNESLKWIWDNCETTESLQELSASFNDKFRTSEPEHVVEDGLRQLSEAGLVLLNSPVGEPVGPWMTRRQLAGVAAAVIPVLTTVLVPPAAAAMSGDGKGKGNGNGGNGNGNGGNGNGGNGNGGGGKGNGH